MGAHHPGPPGLVVRTLVAVLAAQASACVNVGTAGDIIQHIESNLDTDEVAFCFNDATRCATSAWRVMPQTWHVYTPFSPSRLLKGSIPHALGRQQRLLRHLLHIVVLWQRFNWPGLVPHGGLCTIIACKLVRATRPAVSACSRERLQYALPGKVGVVQGRLARYQMPARLHQGPGTNRTLHHAAPVAVWAVCFR